MSNAKKKPIRAFILAAGLGTRLRPYTDHCPKPMVIINGRSLIWRILDQLRECGVCDVVVNTHYLPEMLDHHMRDYVAQYPDMNVHISHEADVLETGGGIVKALQHFKGEPFYVIAGDSLWEDGSIPALDHLAQHWDSDKMDVLSLMQPISQMHLTPGVGDYDIDKTGLVRRSLDKTGAYMWTNIRINTAHIYDNAPHGRFSVLGIMDECEARGRYFALEHGGQWHHISTSADLERVDMHYKQNEIKEKGHKNGAA